MLPSNHANSTLNRQVIPQFVNSEGFFIPQSLDVNNIIISQSPPPLGNQTPLSTDTAYTSHINQVAMLTS